MYPDFGWFAIVDQFVQKLLERAGVLAPPVDVLQLAARMQIKIIRDAGMPERGRAKQLQGQPVIILKPDARLERMHWSAAHELGELHFAELAALAETDPDETASIRENVANLFAKRLLLPTLWFRRDVEFMQYNLLKLKTLYSTASHELIAQRLLDLEQPVIVAICDRGKVMRRNCNNGQPAPRMLSVEKECWQECHRWGRPVEIRQDAIHIRCWPIHEPGWKREILCTTLNVEYSEGLYT